MLIDEMLAGWDRLSVPVDRLVARDLLHSQVMDINNVAEYVYALPREKRWAVGCIKAPFDLMWYEAQVESEPLRAAIGVFVKVVPAIRSLDTVGDVITAMTADPRMTFDIAPLYDSERFTGVLDTLVGEVQIIQSFARVRDSRVFTVIGAHVIFVDREGNCIKNRAGFPLSIGSTTEELALHVTLMAVWAESFLNCKNVGTTDEYQPRQYTRNLERRGEHVFRTYKRLHVYPISHRGGGQETKEAGTRPVHIVRGYFADYTTGAGLFGKYHGRFWVPAHVRGSADVGSVGKEYVLHAKHTK